jgi:type III pantothenate kinase
MIILMDIGNTRLKWATLQQGQISGLTAVNYRQLDWQAELFQAWQMLARVEKILIATVAAVEIRLAVQTLAQQLWESVEIIQPRSTATAFGVGNYYSQAEKLGIDRWLALIAAWHFYAQAAWIIDCGSAITIDFIDQTGKHRGGVIAPGLRLMQQSLAQNTATLSFSNQTYSLGLADCTEAAIFSGCVYAVLGLIEQSLSQQAMPAIVLLTGGDAELIASKFQQPMIIDPYLVLKGLSLFI